MWRLVRPTVWPAAGLVKGETLGFFLTESGGCGGIGRGVYEMNLDTHRERPIYRTHAHLVIGGDTVGVAPGVLLETPQVNWPFLFIEDMNVIFAWRLE
ncbi:hypothetical protein KJ975_01055 [Myxococcota bacterium]|nr:hypothetical protein [Myxococcota bacterium]